MSHVAGDKGSYLVTTPHGPANALDLVLAALRGHCPKISGAAVADPTEVGAALRELSKILASKYGPDFRNDDFGIKLAGVPWRAGLALPLGHVTAPMTHMPSHETKNTLVFGWSSGAALVAKREAKNVHWGSVVNRPVQALIKRTTGMEVDLTSRSANIMRALVERA